MTSTTSERRRLALAGTSGTDDIVVPAGATVGAAATLAGISLDPSRHALLTRSGREIDPATTVEQLTDGTLLSIVDLAAPPPAEDRAAALAATRHDYASVWWALASLGTLLTVLGLLRLASGATLLTGPARPAVAAALGATVLASAAAWVVRHHAHGHAALPLAAIITLSSATAIMAVPAVHGATQLAVAGAFAAQAIVFALMSVAAPRTEVRGLVGTAGTLALVLTAVWGGTLLLEWPATAAAAISLGLVAPSMRVLPSLLLNVHEGYAINYQHFMSQRWTVRGAVPDDPGDVTMDVVRPHVAESTSRLAVGVVLLTAVAVIATPFVLPAMHQSGTLGRIGAIGAIAATTVALVLSPRHRSSPTLRWTPRVGASLIALAVIGDIALRANDGARLVLAFVALAVALVAAGLVIPLAKGASSLVWSRLADFLEWLAVALALPMALLAANVLEAVRTMMAR